MRYTNYIHPYSDFALFLNSCETPNQYIRSTHDDHHIRHEANKKISAINIECWGGFMKKMIFVQWIWSSHCE